MPDDDLIDPSDSASQVTKTSLTSNTSSALRRIDLERKKAELSNLEEISRICKAKLLAQAKAEAAKAEAEEAEALAKLRIERANIEAEEKMLECCSQRGSQISSASKVQAYSRSGLTRVKVTTFRPKSDVNDIKSPFIESRAPKLETAVKTDGVVALAFGLPSRRLKGF